MGSRRALPQILPWLGLTLAPGLTFLALRVNGAFDFEANSPDGHFYIVSLVAAINVALGVFAIAAAVRSANVRVLLLALSFVSMAMIFAVHGLSTPGFLVSEEHELVTGLSSRLSTLVAAVFLAASAIDFPDRINQAIIRARRPLLIGWLGTLSVTSTVAIVRPETVPAAIVEEPIFINGSLVAVVALAGFAAHRYLQGFRRSGLPMYGAVALGSVLIVQAQLGMQYGVKFHATWWLYHVMLLIGFSGIVWGLFIEYARGVSPVSAIEGLTLRDPIEQIQAGYTDSITSLAAALEARDGYTLGHGERVAGLAVLIGQELNLAPDRLRAIYQGALLHDVGKIGVPDRVLHKTGRLSDDEFDFIKGHPTRGETMLKAAFDGPTELAVIRHHHERVDGTGYPDGLSGDDIPLEARIAAVADVYDALRSARSYRPAWTPDEAQHHIRENTRTHFDPNCVKAFFAVVDQWEQRFSSPNTPYLELRPSA